MKAVQGNSEAWLDNLFSKGFAYSEELPSRSLSRLLRKHPELWGRVKIFDSSRSTHGDIDYSHFDYFGRSIRAYFLEDRKEDFVSSIVSEFLKHNNMSPDPDIRRSFTHMLHDYGLCWEGCTTHNGPPIRPQRKANANDIVYWRVKSDEEDHREDMSTEQVILFIADIASLSPRPDIHLTGRDPLGRSDIELILMRANSLGLNISLEMADITYLTEHIPLLKYLSSVGVDMNSNVEELSSLKDKLSYANIIPVMQVIDYNLHSLLRSFTALKKAGFKEWRICFPYGNMDLIEPEEYESILNLLYDFSTYEMKIRICGAPFIFRVAETRKSKGSYWNDDDYLKARAELARIMNSSSTSEPSLYSENNRSLFVDSDGSVYPEQFIDIVVGDVKNMQLSQIYTGSSLLEDIRNSRLKGLCGICRYRLGCGGNRSRSYMILGDPLASDPACLNSSKYIS
jgi:MoaA/NifB/PqqE/SkfB family radical SAM enzyme